MARRKNKTQMPNEHTAIHTKTSRAMANRLALQPPSPNQLSPEPRPTKRRVALAHAKHTTTSPPIHPPPPTKPTLADRFHALPPEIREQIFSVLLVQPPKWDIPHSSSCPLTLPRYVPQRVRDHHPDEIRPNTTNHADHTLFICPNCNDPHFRTWRHSTQTPYVHPWRSTWAPAQKNPYLCTDCYDERIRPLFGPVPQTNHLMCLCARRTNLQVLLVSRRWHVEASRVFYSLNTFAFEDGSLLTNFITNLPLPRRSLLRKVSFMCQIGCNLPNSVRGNIRYTGEDFQYFKDTYIDHGGDPHFGKAMSSLRSLEGLASLELDSLFLNNFELVDKLRRLGMRDLRKVRFVQRAPKDWATEQEDLKSCVYPYLAGRVLVKGGYAADVAMCVKGKGRKWSKKEILFGGMGWRGTYRQRHEDWGERKEAGNL